jgi:hypothetical protein
MNKFLISISISVLSFGVLADTFELVKSIPEMGTSRVSEVNGCANVAFKGKINNLLWVCAPDKTKGNNNFLQMAESCNEEQGFHLATVSVMTKIGVPSQSDWAKGVSLLGPGFDYIVTGQPTRSLFWDRTILPYETTNGVGYLSTNDGVTGAGWQALTDGVTAEHRMWPFANSVEYPTVSLASLCVDASSVSSSYVYDHRWR